MKQFDRILDYIIDQANKYDSRNLQYEQDILFRINSERNKLTSRIISSAVGFNNIIGMQRLITAIEKYIDYYHQMVLMILNDEFSKYYTTAKTQTNDLFSLGNELTKKYSSIKEMKLVHGDRSISFLRDHAFELLKGHSESSISRIRSELGDLLLRGTTDKATVRQHIEKTLNVNRSKAEEIAQTELSRAYNFGVLDGLQEYEALNPGSNVKKYWHGFKYSEVTCTYCRPRIGMIYDLHDDTETLPAHVRCRCVWLPMLDGWDKPVSTSLISKANMLNTGYSSEMIYSRINNRLGIKYAEYMDINSANDFINGDRTPEVMKHIEIARDNAISDTKLKFDIASDMSNTKMSKEFNVQMKFWQQITAQAIVDGDKDLLRRSHDAIKGVMLLPWNGEQLSKWDILLQYINKEV